MCKQELLSAVVRLHCDCHRVQWSLACTLLCFCTVSFCATVLLVLGLRLFYCATLLAYNYILCTTNDMPWLYTMPRLVFFLLAMLFLLWLSRSIATINESHIRLREVLTFLGQGVICVTVFPLQPSRRLSWVGKIDKIFLDVIIFLCELQCSKSTFKQLFNCNSIRNFAATTAHCQYKMCIHLACTYTAHKCVTNAYGRSCSKWLIARPHWAKLNLKRNLR